MADSKLPIFSSSPPTFVGEENKPHSSRRHPVPASSSFSDFAAMDISFETIKHRLINNLAYHLRTILKKKYYNEDAIVNYEYDLNAGGTYDRGTVLREYLKTLPFFPAIEKTEAELKHIYLNRLRKTHPKSPYNTSGATASSSAATTALTTAETPVRTGITHSR